MHFDITRMEQRMAPPPSRLAKRLKDMIAQNGVRPTAAQFGIPVTTLDRLTRDEGWPEYQTLIDLANGFGLPPYEVLEMADFPLGLPNDRNAHVRRLISLIASDPKLVQVVAQLAAIRTDIPDATDRIADYLTFELSRRGINVPPIAEGNITLDEKADELPEPIDEADYIEIVRGIAARVAEDERRSYWETVRKVAQRFLPKRRPRPGDAPGEQSA